MAPGVQCSARFRSGRSSPIIGRAWPPRPAPPHGPEGRSRETKDGPGRKKALAGAEAWTCAVALPEGGSLVAFTW